MKTIDRLRNDPRVEHVDFDDDGLILTLRKGWSFDALIDNRVIGEDTASALLSSLRRAKPYAGPYTD